MWEEYEITYRQANELCGSVYNLADSERRARELKNSNALLTVTVSVAGMEQLNTVISKLQKIKNVISVERSGK